MLGVFWDLYSFLLSYHVLNSDSHFTRPNLYSRVESGTHVSEENKATHVIEENKDGFRCGLYILPSQYHARNSARTN